MINTVKPSGAKSRVVAMRLTDKAMNSLVGGLGAPFPSIPSIPGIPAIPLDPAPTAPGIPGIGLP